MVALLVSFLLFPGCAPDNPVVSVFSPGYNCISNIRMREDFFTNVTAPAKDMQVPIFNKIFEYFL
jgi:hypothetical protein